MNLPDPIPRPKRQILHLASGKARVPERASEVDHSHGHHAEPTASHPSFRAPQYGGGAARAQVRD
jgi:hypothetical protein